MKPCIVLPDIITSFQIYKDLEYYKAQSRTWDEKGQPRDTGTFAYETVLVLTNTAPASISASISASSFPSQTKGLPRVPQL